MSRIRNNYVLIQSNLTCKTRHTYIVLACVPVHYARVPPLCMEYGLYNSLKFLIFNGLEHRLPGSRLSPLGRHYQVEFFCSTYIHYSSLHTHSVIFTMNILTHNRVHNPH